MNDFQSESVLRDIKALVENMGIGDLKQNPFLVDLFKPIRDQIAAKDAEIKKLRAALTYWIKANETGRYEPNHHACQNAKNTLEGLDDDL